MPAPMSRCILVLNRASGGAQRGLDPHEVSREVEQIFREAGHDISTSLSEPDLYTLFCFVTH